MKYGIVIGEDENGSLMTTPLGSPLVFTDMQEACAAAKRIAGGNLIERYPTYGVFVVALRPIAFYLPFKSADQTMVDETIIEKEKHEPDGRN